MNTGVTGRPADAAGSIRKVTASLLLMAVDEVWGLLLSIV